MRRTRAMTVAAALAAGMLVPAMARADVVTRWDFTGTLTASFDGSDTVSGAFTLDQTIGAVTAFDFTIPGGTITPSGWGASAYNFDSTSPSGTFMEVDFTTPNTSVLALLFGGPIASFAGGPLVTESVTNTTVSTQATLYLPTGRPGLRIERRLLRDLPERDGDAGHRSPRARLARAARHRACRAGLGAAPPSQGRIAPPARSTCLREARRCCLRSQERVRSIRQ